MKRVVIVVGAFILFVAFAPRSCFRTAQAADTEVTLLTVATPGWVSNFVSNNIINYNSTNGYSSAIAGLTNAGGALNKTPVAMWILRDSEAANTDGGAATGGGTWDRRVVNLLDYSSSSAYGITLSSSNTIKLTNGTYLFEVTAPAWAVGAHRARLNNITDTAVVAYGSTSYGAAGGSDADVNESRIDTILTVSGLGAGATKEYAVEHRVATHTGNRDFGVPANFGVNEYYTTVKITRLAN